MVVFSILWEKHSYNLLFSPKSFLLKLIKDHIICQISNNSVIRNLTYDVILSAGKEVHRSCPQYFDGYFTFNSKIHSRATRRRDLLHLPAVKTEVAKRSFYYYGCVVFNDISLCLKN